MNKSRPKLFKPSIAALMVASAQIRMSGLELQSYILSLNIKAHSRKDRNSGRGCRHYHPRGAQRYYRFFNTDRECARRMKQMAKGMIPASLVHPV